MSGRPYFYDSMTHYGASTSVNAQHTHGGTAPQRWLITVNLSPDEVGHAGCYPQARAVVDDFGSLRVVGGWR